jgi:hypothetical protein
MYLHDLQQQRTELRIWHALAGMAWVVVGVGTALAAGMVLTLATSPTPFGFALLFALGALPCLAVTCYVLMGINAHFNRNLLELERRIALHPASAVEQARREIEATLTTYQEWLREEDTASAGRPSPSEIRQYIEHVVQHTFTRALE